MTAPRNEYPPPLSIGRPLVSVILPCYTAAPYVEHCIRSVLDQSWDHWELLAVDNGSTDGSRERMLAFRDPRISVLHEPRRGVSHARNLGLLHMRGMYFCFLDADDLLPHHSIRLRLELFRRYPEIHFADGAMQDFDARTGRPLRLRAPWYRGMPFDALMRMDGSCFAGNTWMVKRLPGTNYALPVHMSHSEDQAFYLAICRQGPYASTARTVLHYRTGHPSANSDPLRGHPGYLALYRCMEQLQPPPSTEQLRHARSAFRRTMVRDLLKRGLLLRAALTWFRIRRRQGFLAGAAV